MSKVKPEEDMPDVAGARRLKLWPERWRWRVSLVLTMLIALAGSLAWYNREQLAADFIDDTLAQNGLEASYEIESIGTRRQIITNIVVGDPQLPDLTAERAVLDLSYTYGPPEIGTIALDGLRLYGSLTDGQLSFGSLDPLIFAPSDEPAGLPTLNLKLVDGRARIASDYGVIGAKVEGEGRLYDGFEGKLAATAPGLGIDGCRAGEATIYGDLSSADGRLGFDGPVRVRNVDCEGSAIEAADIGTKLTLARDFGSVEGDLAILGEQISSADLSLAALGGSADFAWAFDGELSVRHALTGEQLVTQFGKAANLGAQGTLRSTDGFGRNEWTSRLTGEDIDISAALSGAGLANAKSASAGTFAGALLQKLETGFSRAAKGSEFAADVSVRTERESVRLVVPEARLKSASGETLIALSRLSYNTPGQGQPERLTGNILTGGAELPRINARLETAGEGESGGKSEIALRMTMAQYRSGDNAISIPRLEARRAASGAIRFNGVARAEGLIPGGTLAGLEMPIEGRFAPATGLALGTRCLDARIAGLESYNFGLEPQTVSVCPASGGARGGALLSYRDELEIAAEVSDMTLSGSLGSSPLVLAANSAIVRFPGASRFEELSATIGGDGNAVHFNAGALEGEFGDGLSGRFEGAAARLDRVPLDLTDLGGKWSFEGNVLTVSESTFTLTESVAGSEGESAGESEGESVESNVPRFEPLQGQGARLTLAKGIIRAETALVHPWSGRRVTDVKIRHDLGSGEGRADISVPGVRFDEGFQPDDLTAITKGLIAFADGTIQGEGRVNWTSDDLTSSGTFSTEGFDFAAAFGPVRGVKGKIEFTDLLGLTTAPSQVATIASVNPGIEALEGRIVYSVNGGTIINLEDGRWPFMGGELIVRPVTLDYGGGQGQSYIFEIIGLDAATFVTQMEITNIGATGRFDGTIPMAFDAQGNGTIQGGLLISRPPGGNVSYVGELTYEDLGTISNYAFQTLRSLDYNQMSIELNGNLTGEIVTNFNIDGVRQGEGASQNFITRQLAELPIRFKINVRSENFYMLATIARGLFDPTIFGDPVDQGLLQIDGQRLVPRDDTPSPVPSPNPNLLPSAGEAERRNEPVVQPPESDDQL